MLKKSLPLLSAVLLLAAACRPSSPAVITTPTPDRPAGQQDVIALTVPPIDTVRIGFVGLGMRGEDAVYRYTQVPWTSIQALCDVVTERAEASRDYVVSKGFPEPACYDGEEGWKSLCERDDIDLVYICTDWLHHVPIALYAMEHGKHVAVEVPAATSLEDCWALVNTAERTRRHCMMLENCCYDFFELTALEMARRGAFGEVLHVEGAYLHNLSEFWDEYWNNWRLTFNASHKGDLYPTHGFGPVCQVLGIHRGDRLKTLVAMETKSVNGKAWAARRLPAELQDFQNGDQTCTMISTERGRSILIEHSVLTPRPYNRMYQIVGSEGYAGKYPVEQFVFEQEVLDRSGIDYTPANPHAALPREVAQQLKDRYVSPILSQELEDKAKEVGGHGGMDFLMDYRLIYCLHYGLPLDMDVYDLAEWCCISELGAISIANNSAPVAVPDFTRGAWSKAKPFGYAFSDGSFR